MIEGTLTIVNINCLLSVLLHRTAIFRMNLLSGLALALVVAVISAEKMRFDHHRVYKVNVENEEQMNVLRQLEETPNGEYSFWDSPRAGHFVDVVVPPDKLYEFGGIMNNFNIVNELKIENLQE